MLLSALTFLDKRDALILKAKHARACFGRSDNQLLPFLLWGKWKQKYKCAARSMQQEDKAQTVLNLL